MQHRAMKIIFSVLHLMQKSTKTYEKVYCLIDQLAIMASAIHQRKRHRVITCFATVIYRMFPSSLWKAVFTDIVSELFCNFQNFSVISSPQPLGSLWAYSIGMLCHPYVCMCVCVCHHFQTSSPLKPLGRLKPNFIWSLPGTGERKFVQMVLVIWPRWSPCPHMVKTFKNLLLRNQKTYDLETWYVALGIQVLPSLFKWWPWVDIDLF